MKSGIFQEQARDFNEYYASLSHKKENSKESFYGSKAVKLAPDERIYIFISSSVPVSTLRNYAASIDRIGSSNIRLVMRGFVGGMKYIMPTMQFISEILKKDTDCDFLAGQKCDVYNASVYIDPLLFRAYNIKEVPSMVYVEGLSVTDVVLSEGINDNVTFKEAYILYGDVSLEYAIEKFKREKGKK